MKAQATIGPKTNGDERCSAAERASMSLVRVRFRVRASMSLVCRNQRGWLSGSASDRASGCPKPRPASANQPRGGSGQPDWRAGLLLAGHRGPAFDVATRQRKLRSMRPSTWLGLGLESESGSGLGLGLGLGSGSGLGLGLGFGFGLGSGLGLGLGLGLAAATLPLACAAAAAAAGRDQPLTLTPNPNP